MPSAALGHKKRPRCNRFVNRQAPWPSCQITFRSLPLRPRKQNSCPVSGPRRSTSCTCSDRVAKPSSCRCDRSPARPARRSEPGSWQRLKPTHDPQQRLHVHVAMNNNAPAVRDHNLDSTTARPAALLRLLRHDHRRHESGNVARPTFAIRLALGKQKLGPIPGGYLPPALGGLLSLIL